MACAWFRTSMHMGFISVSLISFVFQLKLIFVTHDTEQIAASKTYNCYWIQPKFILNTRKVSRIVCIQLISFELYVHVISWNMVLRACFFNADALNINRMWNYLAPIQFAESTMNARECANEIDLEEEKELELKLSIDLISQNRSLAEIACDWKYLERNQK